MFLPQMPCPDLQQRRILPYMVQAFHERLVAGGLLHIVFQLQPHQLIHKLSKEPDKIFTLNI